MVVITPLPDASLTLAKRGGLSESVRLTPSSHTRDLRKSLQGKLGLGIALPLAFVILGILPWFLRYGLLRCSP